MTGSRKPEPGDPDYVGYKNPPKRHQFKVGKSGNPRGRPKGCKSDQTLYEEAANQMVTVRDHQGRPSKVTLRAAAYRQLLIKSAGGSASHLSLFLKYEERFGFLRPPKDGEGSPSGVLLIPGYPGASMQESLEHARVRSEYLRRQREAEEKASAATPTPPSPHPQAPRPGLSPAAAPVRMTADGPRPLHPQAPPPGGRIIR